MLKALLKKFDKKKTKYCPACGAELNYEAEYIKYNTQTGVPTRAKYRLSCPYYSNGYGDRHFIHVWFKRVNTRYEE